LINPKNIAIKKANATGIAAITLFTACQKSSDSAAAGGTAFTATVNGKNITFNLTTATLLRSVNTNQKRLDITGTSTDGSIRLIITLGEETAVGNGVSVKAYVLNPFPPDDPSTPNIDESLTTQGFTTYSTSLGNNNWFTNVYDENGSFTVCACDSNSKTVSGNFQTTLTDNYNNPGTVITITNGKMTNIKYAVLN
jgi:hypothetical protein